MQTMISLPEYDEEQEALTYWLFLLCGMGLQQSV